MAGDVDARSIADVSPGDLDGYTRCHFFAGIGLWDLALTMAGWPEDEPVWTGSCPCQPFSRAGLGKGSADARHLFPAWAVLLAARRPPAVFGEQVGGKAGGAWISSVRDSLEGMGYRVGAADLCAAGIGAPHVRQRIYWVGQSAGEGLEGAAGAGGHGARGAPGGPPTPGSGDGVADAERGASERHGLEVARAPRGVQSPPQQRQRVRGDPEHDRHDDPWAGDWIGCSDGRTRPIPPIGSGLLPLAHGTPGRVGHLRAYGNAIVPQLAAEFVSAFMEVAP